VSWLSKKQYSVSISIVEVECIAIETCCTQFLWMKQDWKDIKVEYDHSISIICDNTSGINISKNHVMHSTKKHILIKDNFLREKVSEHNIKLEYIVTK
jgi:hypothetical protein